MSESSDRDWQRFATDDPYWAVLTEDRFRGASMGEAARAEFFALGQRHVESIFERYWDLAGRPLEPARALDFGCGVGRVLPALSARCGSVVGVDVAPAMIEEASANVERLGLGNVELRVDSDELDTLAGDFDFIHSVLVFQHIEPDRGERIVGRLCELLRAGGVAVLQFTTESRRGVVGDALDAMRERHRPLHALLNLLSGASPRQPLMRMHVYSPGRIAAIANRSGCSVLGTREADQAKYGGVVVWIERPG